MNLKGIRLLFFKQETKDSPKDDISEEETDTINIATSEDGWFDDNDQEEEYGRFDKHPGEGRRKRTQRLASYILVGFFLFMFVVLISLNHRKSKKIQGLAINNTKVYCSGKLTYSLDEWLKDDLKESAKLCDPDVSIRGPTC